MGRLGGGVARRGGRHGVKETPRGKGKKKRRGRVKIGKWGVIRNSKKKRYHMKTKEINKKEGKNK